MPCNSDYMNATQMEHEMSRVFDLLDELKGKPFCDSEGYHPKVYNKGLSKSDCDTAVAKLCGALQDVDVTQYSLEMQMWWRDHQRVDAKRVKTEVKAAKDEKERKAALAKLTKYERRLLGV